MDAGIPALGPAHMQAPDGEVDIIPAQCHQLRGPLRPWLIGDATEEIKRLREQLIECDAEIRDLRYRMHLRGYNSTLW